MGLEQRRQTIKAQREQLIGELETLYMAAFERIGQLELGEGAVARLTQLMLRSRKLRSPRCRRKLKSRDHHTCPGT